jgi:hypothetical protein
MMTRLPVSLLPHPDHPASGVHALTVVCRRLAGGPLELRYRLEGDLAGLRLPDPVHPVAPDRLWAHSCFELFLARAGQPGYREYNFSPSGQWAGYAFSDYRQRLEGWQLPLPVLDWRLGENRLELTALLSEAALPEGEGALQLGLATVLELADGRLSYWALHHPCDRPDFHHRGGFTLMLESP